MSQHSFFDSNGNDVFVGTRISEGAEGIVRTIVGQPHLVGKIYHSGGAIRRESKLQAMLRLRSDALLKVSAWPVDLLFDKPGGAIVGFLMKKAVAAQELHRLTGKERQPLFPKARWPFLIHTAANVARAVTTVHESGHVIGDINESGILVAQDATVTLVDCDSFQIIQSNGNVLLCEVGKPEYTPPEFRGSFSTVQRTRAHDRFGLAVIIFQLLFLGRHPFAGTPLDGNDWPIEKAIRSYRFAFGEDAKSRNVKPPPYIIKLEEVSLPVTTLFRRAFLSSGDRPTSQEWVTALTRLRSELIVCRDNDGHHYYRGLLKCPWCRAEQESRVVFFERATFVGGGHGVAFNLASVWDQISNVGRPGTAAALPKRDLIKVGFSARIKAINVSRFWVRTILAALALLGSLAILLWMLVDLVTPFWLVCFGIFAAYVVDRIIKSDLFLPPATRTAMSVAESKWNAAVDAYKKRTDLNRFDGLKTRLQTQKDEYLTLPGLRNSKMKALYNSRRERQLHRFLSKFTLRGASIPDIGYSRTLTLKSYGIESAADISWQNVLSVPGFGPALTSRLVGWRQSYENRFVFDASAGIEPADVQLIDQEIVKKRTELEMSLSNGAARLTAIADEINNSHEKDDPNLLTALRELVFAENLTVKRGGIWARSVAVVVFAGAAVAMATQAPSIRRTVADKFTQSRRPVTGPTPTVVSTPIVPGGGPLSAEEKQTLAHRYYEEGKVNLRAGKYADAAKNYEQAIEMDPEFAPAYHDLGYTRYKLGKFQDAIDALQNAVKRNSSDADSFRNLGLTYQKLNQWENAAKNFAQSLKLDPKSAANYQSLGECYAKLGKYERAVEVYQKAVELNPNSATAHLGLGLAYLHADDPTSAQREYELLISLDAKLAEKLRTELYGPDEEGVEREVH